MPAVLHALFKWLSVSGITCNTLPNFMKVRSAVLGVKKITDKQTALVFITFKHGFVLKQISNKYYYNKLSINNSDRIRNNTLE